VVYAKAFFDLQLKFAQSVAALSELPLDHALLAYTNLYIRFGLGRDLDRAHPRWQEYLAGLRDASDPGEWTYRFYTQGPYGQTLPPIVAISGCFSYSRLRADRIRLHFENTDADECSSLGGRRRDQRLADLAALFAWVKLAEPGDVSVVGASWLYNLEAYRRLFPKSYVASTRVLLGRFQHMPLWGQFLNRHGAVKEAAARVLLERLSRLSSLEDLDACFPLPVLAVEASAREFYEFYGV
jgi:hypothetical protein